MSVHIQLEQFEGPMGLLLYLIRKEEMNIYDIQIHRITSQYLEYVKNMKELDLEGAGEFVQMAASLLLIKSRMLLPQTDEKGDEIEAEDPRKELVRRLVEYEKFREASKQLGKRPLLNRDVFARGTRESFDALEDLVTVDDGGLFQMISLYRALLKKVNSGIHQVTQKFQTIASRILELKGRLQVGMRVELRDLLSEPERHRDKLLITFLSMLELARLQLVSLFQSESYGPLHVEPKAQFDESIVTHVQEYDVDATSPAPALVSTMEQDGAMGPVGEKQATESESSPAAELSEDDFLKAMAEPTSADPLPSAAGLTEMATDDDILQAEIELGLVAAPASSSADVQSTAEGDELHFELDLSQSPVLPGLEAGPVGTPHLFALPDPEDLLAQEMNLSDSADEWARIDQSLKRIEDQLDRMDWSVTSLRALDDAEGGPATVDNVVENASDPDPEVEPS